MSTYRLKYREDGFGVTKEVEFDAAHSAEALRVARGEARGRTGELWHDGQLLCSLRHAPGENDWWVINPQF